MDSKSTKQLLQWATNMLPDGYAIVPIEPTEAMLSAGTGSNGKYSGIKLSWQAMIKAFVNKGRSANVVTVSGTTITLGSTCPDGDNYVVECYKAAPPKTKS